MNKRNKKIILCTPFYKRHEITKFVFDYYYKIKCELDGVIDIILLSCGSEFDKSRKIAEEFNYIYINEKNEPLSQKQNKLYLKAKEYNPDACMKLDSDTIISKEYFIKLNELLLSGYDYISIKDIYFAFNNGVGYWGGYNNHREGEGVGTGRVMSKKLLNDLNWMPWENSKLNKGLDGYLTKNIKKNQNKNNYNYKSRLFSCKEENFNCIDLKSDINITNPKNFIFNNWYNYNENVEFNDMLKNIKNNLINYKNK